MRIAKFFFLFIFTVFILASCVEPLVISCRSSATDQNNEWKYTEEQAKAACAIVDRYLAGKFNSEKGIWQIDYAKVITIEEALKYITNQLASLDALLSYKNEKIVDSVDFFGGFRRGLEKEEKKLKWVEQRLNYIVNYNIFVDKVGETDSEAAKNLMRYGRKAYSLRLIYPLSDIKQLKFKADYVESAKKDGVLKLVNEFPIVEKKEFAEKVIDKDDPAKFSWKKHYRGWLIKAYKVLPDKEQPMSNSVDYLEIYKAKFNPTKDGKEFAGYEEQFAVAGFKSRGKEAINIFVIDYKLDILSGFSPDKIFESLADIIFGNEVYINDALRKEIMEPLFNPPTQEKEHRQKPLQKPLYAEIAKMGEVNASVWEEGEFRVPFAYSSQGPGRFDLDTNIVWDLAVNPADKKIEEEHGLKKIKFFKVDYKKMGKIIVMEYYIPKNEYSQRDIKQGFSYGDIVKIQRSGYPEVSSERKFFTDNDKPKIIDYEHGGRWYRIMDADGDGKFEKRCRIADPTTVAVVPNY